MERSIILKQASEIEVTSGIVFCVSITFHIYWFIRLFNEYSFLAFLLFPIGMYMSIFFVNSFLINVVCLIIPPGWLKKNSQYFTSIPIETVKTYQYPSLSIQIPVYKESFETTIQPTLLQSLDACKQYTETTGAAANILVCDDGLAVVSEAEKDMRIQFYTDHEIGWISRPAYGRRGRFKKAGNLNYAFNHTTLNSIILLLDSDSRIPTKGLEQAVREFVDSELGFLQMQTRTLFSQKPSLWEQVVGHFTNNIYALSFRIVTSFGDPSPLVGHNVFLRRKALQECSSYDSTVLKEGADQACNVYGFQFFSEDHVSEDFELSMRLQTVGYKARYATYLDGFEEGVTLTTVDEIIRLQKYAYGVNELTLHPIRHWCSRGILGPTFKAYILSSHIPLSAKYNVLGYLGMYYALGLAPILVTAHYFGYHFCPIWNTFFVSAEQILYACLITFTLLTPISSIVLKKKLGLPLSILKEFACSCLFGFFFTGIGIPICSAILSHFLGLSMTWSATNKDISSSSFLQKIRSVFLSCWIQFIISFLQLIVLGVGWWCFNLRDWKGILPMAISATAHSIVPFLGL